MGYEVTFHTVKRDGDVMTVDGVGLRSVSVMVDIDADALQARVNPHADITEFITEQRRFAAETAYRALRRTATSPMRAHVEGNKGWHSFICKWDGIDVKVTVDKSRPPVYG
jgi:hypothetical protein